MEHIISKGTVTAEIKASVEDFRQGIIRQMEAKRIELGLISLDIIQGHYSKIIIAINYSLSKD